MSIKFVASTVLTAKDQTRSVFANMAKNAKHAEQSVRSLRNAGESLKSMGTGLAAGVSTPMAGLGANALKMTTDFGASMNNVQAKLLATTKDMKPLRDMAKDLGSTTAFSAKQAADGMGFLAQAGFDAKQIMTGLPTVLNLASAAQMDLAQAADIASNVMGAFQLKMDSAGTNISRVADTLALASARSNTSVQELAESMKSAAPVAQAFGVDIEQASAMIGMLANNGIKGEQAGTVFKNMMTNLASPAGGAEKAMKKLNLQQSSFFKKNKEGKMVFLGVSKMLRTLTKAGAEATDMIDIFGAEAGPGMLSIAQSAKAIEQLEQDISGSGAAAKMAKIQMQGLPGVMKSIASAWEGANLALVESGAFDPLINGIKSVTKGLQEMAKSDPEKLKAIVTFAAGAALIGPALMVAGGSLAGLAVIVKSAAGAFALLSGAALPLTVLAGAAYLVYKNWAQVSVFFKGFALGVAGGFKEIKEAMRPMLSLLSPVVDWLKKLVSPLMTANKEVAGLAYTGYQFGAAMKWVIAPVGAFVATVMAMKGLSVIAGGLTLVVGAVKAIGLAMMANPIGVAVAAVGAAVYVIYNNWDGISAWFSQKWEQVKAVFDGGIGSMVVALAKFSPVYQIYKHWDGISAWFAGKLAGLKMAISSGITSVVSAFAGFNPAALIYSAWSGINTWFANKWLAVKEQFGAGVDAAIMTLVKFSPVYQIYKHWDGLTAYFANLWQTVKSTVSGGIEEISALLRNFNPLDLLNNIGSNIATGLKNGMASAANGVADSAKGMAKGAGDAVKNFFGIKSPSRLMMGYGQNIVQGLANGITGDNSAQLALQSLSAPELTQSVQPLLSDVPLTQTLTETAMSGSVNADITVRVESSEGLRVVSTGVETKKEGSLMRNVGVSMAGGR